MPPFTQPPNWSMDREDLQTAEFGPILLFANVPFSSAWQRCQQLALCWAKWVDVIYVDPNRSFLQRFVRPGGRGNAEELPRRLRLFIPPEGLPLARSFGPVNRINYARSLRALRKYLKGRGLWPPTCAVLTYPDQVEALGGLGHLPVVYDLMDEPSLFLRAWQKPRYVGLHQRLLRQAAAVVTSSEVLRGRYAGWSERVTCITNGVRENLFAELAVARPVPALDRLPRPRFGYVGMISHWFDFPAVAALARAFPEGQVILVGPVEGRVPRLPANVLFTGPVSNLELASYLRSFDIGLIPFLRSPTIDAVNPIKLYEYLAAGLPVLASRFEELARFGHLLENYGGPDEAVTAARRLLALPQTPAVTGARRDFALQHCWGAKAWSFLKVIRTACARARPSPPQARIPFSGGLAA